MASDLLPSTPKARLIRAGRPGAFAAEPEEVRPDGPALGHPRDVAGVVPAIGDAILVGIGLQVVELRRPGAAR